MGGKAAMALALTEPARVRRLIVADIAPVAYAHSQIALRPARCRRSTSPRVTRRSEADAALAAAVPDPAVRAFLLQSLAFGDGQRRLEAEPRRPRRADAAHHRLPRPRRPLPRPHPVPVRRHLRLRPPGALAPHPRALPGGPRQAIPGAGHWLHADAPAAFIAAVAGFLDAAD